VLFGIIYFWVLKYKNNDTTMRNRMMFCVIALLLACSCTNPKNGLPKWLLGTWKNETSRGTIFESWIEESDFEYVGVSYSLHNGDSTVFETIRIIKDGDSMLYVPTVKTQNNAQPVRFFAKSVTSDKLVFENPSHDYPQLITYRLISTDSLIAEISGKINGQERVKRFPMKRVKP
jgi:hypothetical protein